MSAKDEYESDGAMDEGDFEDGNSQDYEYDFTEDIDTTEVEEHHVKGKQKPENVPLQLLRESSAGYSLRIPYNSYYILQRDQSLQPMLNALVDEVSSCLFTTADESLMLLQQTGYSKERLMDQYMDHSQQVRTAAGLTHYNAEEIATQLNDNYSRQRSSSSVVTCAVCFDDDVMIRDTFSLGCSHRFCRTCFNGHLSAKVSEGLQCVRTNCPQRNCSEVVPPSVFRALLQDPADRDRYEHFLVTDFVSKTSYFRYCPTPNCGRVAIGSGISEVDCECGNSFCFQCGETSHDPCSCQQLRQWQLKNHDESENVTWILAYTKPCPNPKCGKNIEKNAGCNHMHCLQCHHHFCWVCMGDWSKHRDSWNCNAFAAKNKDSQDAAVQARHELERYMHYFNRFKNHDGALKYAQTMLKTAQAELYARRERSTSVVMDGEEYLTNASKQLITCRRLLMYTYVLGYYLKDATPQKALFEFQQGLLEQTTDRLQELAKAKDSILPANRLEILRLTDVVRGFFEKAASLLQGGVVRIMTDSTDYD